MDRRAFAGLALGLFSAAAYAPQPRAAQDHGHGHDHAHDHAEHDHEDEFADHVAEGAGLRAVHAWARATREPAALVFVDLENVSSHAVTVTGARSAHAQGAELVGFRLVDGATRHDAVGPVPIDAGGAINFTPFGLAIRLTGLNGPLTQGETFVTTLVTDHGEVDMVVEIEAVNAVQHSHAGHQH